MDLKLFFGDLHSHCSISYGEGTVQQALARARGQLDFCSVTGHAFWPDMPQDRERYGEIIDYHHEGFARLAGNWARLLAELDAGSQDGHFVTFPSYEWHSLRYGDHNVYAPGPQLPLRDAADLAGLRAAAESSGAILVPHHIGYAAGYRGIDWRSFDERQSPIVEIYSLHGSSESDEAAYPMLHDMGPRDSGSTAVSGWRAGHRFGVIASTDHHGGYPGSHGDGRAAVWARALTRDAIWEALRARRVYAVTGDKIDARLTIEGAWPGEVIRLAGPRHLKIDVRGSAALDRVEVLKNGRLLRRIFPREAPAESGETRYRLRVTWGWGRKDEVIRWTGRLALSAGRIWDVETCFSGQTVLAPRGVGGHTDQADAADLPHEVLEHSERTVAWRSVTTGNRSTRHATTQAISLGIEARLSSRLILEVNGRRIDYDLGELLQAARSTYLRGWLSEAILVGPLDPIEACTAQDEFVDPPETDCDRYRIRVAQVNGQWAWLTPIWVER